MSVSDRDKKRLNEIREVFLLTLKSSTVAEQRSRISKNLRIDESLITDINAGKWINPIKLRNVLADFNPKEENLTNNDITLGDTCGYLDRIKVEKISQLNNDYEIDCIYSYFKYFKKNFLHPVSKSNIELNYNLGKKREDFIEKSGNIDKLLKDYKADLEILTQVTEKEKIEYYNSKFAQRRKNLFLQCAEMFVVGNKLTNEIIRGKDSDEGGIFNADQKYIETYDFGQKSIFERQTNYYILNELKKFTEEILSFLNIPGYESEG